MRLLILANPRLIHARRWINWFAGRSHELLVATCEPEREGNLDAPQRRIASLPGQGVVKFLSAVPSIVRVIRKFRPELINAHFLPGYPFVAALAGAHPLAITTWGSDVLLNPGRGPFFRARARYALGRADLLTCDSPVLTSALAELGVSRTKIVEQPLGIDPELFYPAAGRAVSDRPLRIVSTRSHEPLYDLGSLIETLRLLHDDGREFSAAFAGSGSLTGQLRDECSRRGLERLVEFPGELDPAALANLLRGADVYLSCSHSDSTSVSLLEAMACGAFPVVTAIPGNRVWIEHGVNGMLFPPGDSRALAGCIVAAAENKRLRAEAANANWQIIRDRAIWSDNMGRVEQALLGLIQPGVVA